MRSFLVLLCLVASSFSHHVGDPSCDEKQVIVQLFEWKWADIAAECESFLGPKGFCAVQVSPPNEHVMFPDDDFPWWQRYQPVSYILESQSGSRAEFQDMVSRCNNVGVRIIVDAVINHMSSGSGTAFGSAGSSFDLGNLDYPAVPYGPADFTPSNLCPSASGVVDDNQDPANVRNCYLFGLPDIFQQSESVRARIASYFNDVIDIGVTGFHIDAATNIYPDDLLAIQNLTNDLSINAGFHAGSRPFFSVDVRDEGNQAVTVDEYYGVGPVTEYRYVTNIKNAIADFSLLADVYNPAQNMANEDHSYVFVDNQDTQRDDGSALSYKDGRDYTMAVVYTLAQDYGFTRIMSGYDFTDTNSGPPGTGEGGVTDNVVINADGTCGGGWVCEHRWSSIANMIQFRNAVNHDTVMENFLQEGNTVSFSRGNLGFFVMNQDGDFTGTLQTGLPAGNYCDVISSCAKTVTVNDDGSAHIVIDDFNNPFVAICVGCS